MTKKCLHRRFPHATAHHLGSQPMPERVRRHFALDTKSFAKLSHNMLDRPRADRPSRLSKFIPSAKGGKHSSAARLIAALFPVCRKELGRLAIEQHRAALSTLRPVDMSDAILNGNVAAA